jgi:hypothetical protein
MSARTLNDAQALHIAEWIRVQLISKHAISLDEYLLRRRYVIRAFQAQARATNTSVHPIVGALKLLDKLG